MVPHASLQRQVKFFSSCHFPFDSWFLQPPKMDENGHQPPDEPVVRNQVLGPQNREIQRESGNKKNLEVFFWGGIKTNPKCIKNTEMDGKSGKTKQNKLIFS